LEDRSITTRIGGPRRIRPAERAQYSGDVDTRPTRSTVSGSLRPLRTRAYAIPRALPRPPAPVPECHEPTEEGAEIVQQPSAVVSDPLFCTCEGREVDTRDVIDGRHAVAPVRVVRFEMSR